VANRIDEHSAFQKARNSKYEIRNKFKAPNPKQGPKSKHQGPNKSPFSGPQFSIRGYSACAFVIWHLLFGICLLFGACHLRFAYDLLVAICPP
jgi:hypothetical protein